MQQVARVTHVPPREYRQTRPGFSGQRFVWIDAGTAQAFGVKWHRRRCMLQQKLQLVELTCAELLRGLPLRRIELVLQSQQLRLH